MLHPSMLDEASLLTECESRRRRRSGPGGQHRNKVETAVVITHLPTGIQGEATERRSQEQNRKVAIFRLRVNLAIHVRRELTSCDFTPSKLWQQRCRNLKISVSEQHNDFPAMLSEAMDVLAESNWEPKIAAELLKCSASQLVKLLRQEPAAFTKLNQSRTERGLRVMR